MTRIWLFAILSVACSSAAFATQSFQFYSAERGHYYTVTSTAVGTALTFPGHWTYEPSVITPSSLTGGNYVLLFTANRVAGNGNVNDEAIFMSTSPNGTSNFSTPQILLRNSGVTNLCDMVDARPIFDGSNWHVYVQAVPFASGTSGACAAPNAIYEATGPSLTSLSWTYANYPYLQPLLTINPSHDNQTGPGIGEGMQWFNTTNYGGPWYQPYLITYNDWNFNGGGGTMFGGLFGPAGGCCQFGSWWYTDYSTAYNSTDGAKYPDVMLAGAASWNSIGIPSLTVSEKCIPGQAKYNYMDGVAFYPNPAPFQTQSISQVGYILPGPIESVTSDSNGGHGFRPRFARDANGYIPASGGYPNTWSTYLYYNDSQINVNNSDGGSDCSGSYTNWGSSQQRFSVTQVTITEN